MNSRSVVFRRLEGRATVAVATLALVASALLGVAASLVNVTAVLMAAVTLLPVASHVRWVGFRAAVSEPSPVTLILFFYLCVFPQRGLVIAANQFTDVKFALTATTEDLAATLLLASLGTTVFVESFHLVRRRSGGGAEILRQGTREMRRVIPLATLLGFLALAALAAAILQNGGFAGAQTVFLSHSKTAAVEARSYALSLWSTVTVPAVWAAAAVVAGATVRRSTRLSFGILALIIVLSQILVFGSRLQALVALMGAWVVVHYSRRALPVAAILIAFPAVMLLSVPIVSQREGQDLARLPTYERYSRIASYGVLDSTLGIRQHRAQLKAKLDDPYRWLNLPLYLVPTLVWPEKPTLDDKRLDLYVARAVGGVNQADTGFPAGYGTELWLYRGWPAVLLGSMLFGALVGALDRRLLNAWQERRSVSGLLWYCFLVALAFTYYKDGDLVTSAVSVIRGGTYLGIAMIVTGVSTLLLDRARDSAHPRPFARIQQG